MGQTEINEETRRQAEPRQQQQPPHSSGRGTAYLAATVFVSLLMGLQAMSYIFRASQGDMLPEHRRKHWHGLQFLSDVVGHQPHHEDLIHEDYFSHRVSQPADPLLQDITHAYNTLMHDPAFKSGLSAGQTELDLDVGVDEDALQAAEDAEGSEDETESKDGGEEMEEVGKVVDMWMEQGVGQAKAGEESSGEEDSLDQKREVEQEEDDKEDVVEEGKYEQSGVGADAVAHAAMHDGQFLHGVQPQQQVRAAAAAPVVVAVDPAVDIHPKEKAHTLAEISLDVPVVKHQAPRTIVTKQQDKGFKVPAVAFPKPPALKSATAAVSPKQDSSPKGGDGNKPGRARRGRPTHAERIARIVKRLYKDKKVYSKFSGHVAMSRQSLPAVGSPIKTPWKIIPTGEWRTLGKVGGELLSVLPATDVVGAKHYKTCAVVGSAGVLLTQEYGPEIDRHDCVIRFNIAPTKGFERHAGAKTTIRFVNRLHFGYRETAQETVLQHVTMPDMMTKFVLMMKKNRGMPTYPFDMSFYEQMIEWAGRPDVAREAVKRGAVSPLTSMLGLPWDNMRASAAKALAALAVDVSGQVAVGRAGALGPLVLLAGAEGSGGNLEVRHSALMALTNLAVDGANCRAIARADGVSVLVAALSMGEDLRLRAAAAQSLVNVATSDDRRVQAADSGALTALVGLLGLTNPDRRVQNTIGKYYSKAPATSTGFVPSDRPTGDALTAVVAACNALSNLMMHEPLRRPIVAAGAVTPLVALLLCASVTASRAAAVALQYLATLPDAFAQIQRLQASVVVDRKQQEKASKLKQFTSGLSIGRLSSSKKKKEQRVSGGPALGIMRPGVATASDGAIGKSKESSTAPEASPTSPRSRLAGLLAKQSASFAGRSLEEVPLGGRKAVAGSTKSITSSRLPSWQGRPQAAGVLR